MDFLVSLAEGFIKIFNTGGATLVSLITGILPTLIVLLDLRQCVDRFDRLKNAS